MNYHSISVNQTRYATSFVDNYLATDTVKIGTNFYNTTFPHDMIFTKDYTSTSDEKVEKLTREFNIRYIFFILSLIYLLSTKVCLSFAAHKLEIFSSNTGKVHYEGLVNLLRYIRDNKNLGLK